MPEQVHPLATEAARLGVSSSTLSEAVSKGRRCAGRDVLSRARFDARSGRCIGFVPAAEPETYYHNGVPAPVPLTLEEVEAVKRGDLTPEEAEAEARARLAQEADDDQAPEEVEPDDDGPTPTPPPAQRQPVETEAERIERRAAELAEERRIERAAEARAAELLAEAETDEIEAEMPDEYDEPDDESDEDPVEECAAWWDELTGAERRLFIERHGADELERLVEARAVEIVNDELEEAGLPLVESVNGRIMRQTSADDRLQFVYRRVDEGDGFEPIESFDADELATMDADELMDRTGYARYTADELAELTDDERDGFGIEDAADVVLSGPGFLAAAGTGFLHGLTLGLFAGDDDEDDDETEAAPERKAA